MLRNAQLHFVCHGILFIVNSPSSAQGAPFRRHERLREPTKSRGGIVGFPHNSRNNVNESERYERDAQHLDESDVTEGGMYIVMTE